MPGDDMAGWLALHGLTAAALAGWLDRPPPPVLPPPAPFAPALPPPARAAGDAAPPASLAQAWPRVCAPLACWLTPGVQQRLLACRPVPPPPAARNRAFTLPAGPDGLPLVAAPWSGRPADLPRDLMRLAHEAGHAAQALQAPAGALPPPILRETCACLAERALVSALTGTLGRRLADLWQAETRRILGPLAAPLRAALHDPAAPYDYGWNYPPARLLALALPEAACPALFAARVETAPLLALCAAPPG